MRYPSYARYPSWSYVINLAPGLMSDIYIGRIAGLELKELVD
jgi:hypothetical protein